MDPEIWISYNSQNIIILITVQPFKKGENYS